MSEKPADGSFDKSRDERRREYPLLIATMDTIKEEIGKIDKSVERIEKLINGNGRIGMFSKIEILWRGNIYFLCLIIPIIIGILIKLFTK